MRHGKCGSHRDLTHVAQHSFYLPCARCRHLFLQQSAQARPVVSEPAFHQLVSTRNDLRVPLHGTLQPHRREECAWLAHVERRFRTDLRGGTVTYAFSFLINGPLVDKIGGKRGILIAALGAATANVALGVITWLVLTDRIARALAPDFFGGLRAQHVFPELRRGLDHQGEGELVSCARARCVRRDFWNTDFVRRLFRIRLGSGGHQHDQSECPDRRWAA